MNYIFLFIILVLPEISIAQSQFGLGEELTFKNNEIMPSLFFSHEYKNYTLQAPFFNIVGEKIIGKAINCHLISKEGVRFINGVPMALKMMV